MFKNVLALVLVLCLSLFGCSQPSTTTKTVTSQPANTITQSTPDPVVVCQTAIDEAKSEIADVADIVFNDKTESDISNLYEDAPKGRLQQYQLMVGGAGGRNILNYSPKLMTEVSTNIINNCSEIGSIKFELSEADERVANHKLVYGLIDGSIKEFECVSPSEETSKLKWGQASC